jgi:hypothetical protein
MKTTIRTSNQLELAVALGTMIINKQSKLKSLEKDTPKLVRISLEDSIDDIKYILENNCSKSIMRQVMKCSRDESLKTIISKYL